MTALPSPSLRPERIGLPRTRSEEGPRSRVAETMLNEARFALRMSRATMENRVRYRESEIETVSITHDLVMA